MNISLVQAPLTSGLLSQVWDRVQSYSFIDSIQIRGSSLGGPSLSLLVAKVGERANFICSLIPFTLFAAAKFPWAAAQVGFSVKECLTACDFNERIEKGLEILEALGNMCFAGITTTVAVCQCLKRCTPWLLPLGVVGGILQFGGVGASIYGVSRNKSFAKEMSRAAAISQAEVLVWITRQPPGVLKKQFRLLNGEDLIQFAVDLLEDSQATHCKDKLLTLLKGRLKNTMRGDLVTLAARVVGVIGVPLLFMYPLAGLAFSGVSTTLRAVVPTRDYFFDY